MKKLDPWFHLSKKDIPLSELRELRHIVDHHQDRLRLSSIADIEYKNFKFPLLKIELGSQNPQSPVLIVSGGIHGLERIGTHVNFALLKSFLELARWDRTTQELLKHLRIIFYPIVNPVGMMLNQRSNPQGVDLMRNAPLDAEEKVPLLLGGQYLSSKLPWFRGAPIHQMEVESQALVYDILSEIKNSPATISLDIHSGFGFKDQLWFPFAYTRTPFPFISELHVWKKLFDGTHPHHIYVVEPQARHYLTHGDLWDYIFLEWKKIRGAKDGIYLPLCLELGSWLWMKKNPKQIFSALGLFNPVVPHRHQRILRRHYILFEFLTKSLRHHEIWSQLTDSQKKQNNQAALNLWYPDSPNS